MYYVGGASSQGEKGKTVFLNCGYLQLLNWIFFNVFFLQVKKIHNYDDK